MKSKEKKQVIRRISKYLFEHKVLFAITLLLACLMTGVSISVPTVIQEVLDNIFQSDSFENDVLMYGILLIGIMFLGKEILNCLRIRVNNKLEQRVIFKIRKDLHDKLLDLPISFYDRRKSGEIASRVVEDVQNVERAILDGTEQGIIALLLLPGNKHDVFTRTPFGCSGIFTSTHSGHSCFNYAKVSKKIEGCSEASGELNYYLLRIFRETA